MVCLFCLWDSISNGYSPLWGEIRSDRSWMRWSFSPFVIAGMREWSEVLFNVEKKVFVYILYLIKYKWTEEILLVGICDLKNKRIKALTKIFWLLFLDRNYSFFLETMKLETISFSLQYHNFFRFDKIKWDKGVSLSPVSVWN